MLVAMRSVVVLIVSSFSLPRQFQCYHNQTILQSHYVMFFCNVIEAEGRYLENIK